MACHNSIRDVLVGKITARHLACNTGPLIILNDVDAQEVQPNRALCIMPANFIGRHNA